MIDEVSIIGWIHTFFSTAAMLTGAVALFARKGSVQHMKWGLWYFYVMIATNLSALLIYSDGRFLIFHWMAIGTLVLVVIGWYAARRQTTKAWACTHLTGMIWSYYMLIGGAINEAFLRLEFFRAYSPFYGAEPVLFGMTQMLALLFFVVLWIYYIIKVLRRFPRRGPAQA